ncbi:MAG: type I methionyl aminopeptidase [Syntrophomonadaceae bacterium]|nr:type I methionyl aminopeptidase [Syntrophomonadaceae bacterium]
MINIKTPGEIDKMRKSGRVVAQVLQILREEIKPGVTTGRLNSIAEEEAKKRNATTVFKNYPHPKGMLPFPGAICTSVNEEVVHGIPGKRVLQEGDIISIDFGVIVDGFAGDAAITVAVGEVDPQVKNLIRVTEAALMKGIDQAQVGNRLGNVSHAIQEYVEKAGFSVVRDYVGHGIGRNMHEAPPVPNYGKADRGPALKAGMTLAIEPMVNLGTYSVFTKGDEWTVVTRDGKHSAHFEHSIAIRDQGPEILTLI